MYDPQTLLYTVAGIFLLATIFILIETGYENYNEYKTLEQEKEKAREVTKALTDLSARRTPKVYNSFSELEDFDPHYN